MKQDEARNVLADAQARLEQAAATWAIFARRSDQRDREQLRTELCKAAVDYAKVREGEASE